MVPRVSRGLTERAHASEPERDTAKIEPKREWSRCPPGKRLELWTGSSRSGAGRTGL